MTDSNNNNSNNNNNATKKKIPHDDNSKYQIKWIVNEKEEEIASNSPSSANKNDDVIPSSSSTTVMTFDIKAQLAELLRSSFPQLVPEEQGQGQHQPPQEKEEEEKEVERIIEGCLGFHDEDNVHWAIVEQVPQQQQQQKQQSKQRVVIGLMTVSKYHDGIQICNICVQYEYRCMGLALKLLREAGRFAVNLFGNGSSSETIADEQQHQHQQRPPRLLGNCDGSNKKLLGFYKALGAKVDQRRMGIGSGGGGGGGVDVVPSVPLYRELPHDIKDVDPFFDGLEELRQTKRLQIVVAAEVEPEKNEEV